MNWDDLRCFLAVARAGTLSGAAEGLGLTQPSVGRRIAAFEAALGARLFERTSAGHVLTATGRRLVPFAERMETDALAAERTVSGRDVGLRGPVRITASEWLVGRVLAPLVAPVLARNPQLEIELLAEARHLSLVRGEAEIAIRPSRFEHQEVIQIEVGSLEFGLFASEAYLAAHGMPDFGRLCDGHALIAMSESLTRIPDLEFLPGVAGRARVVARANGRLPMATLAAAGVGIACLPLAIGADTPSLRLLPTPVPGPRRTLWLAIHRGSRSIPRVRHTTAYLRDELRKRLRGVAPAPA